MANDDVYNYGTNIHERPEFLMTLGELFPQAQKLKASGDVRLSATESTSLQL